LIKSKFLTGHFWKAEDSNFFKKDLQGNICLNKINVLGLIIRTCFTIMVQTSTMLALMYAKKSGLNQGLITSMFATYCIFTTVFSYFLFNEKLSLKFSIGISFMIACVALVAGS
jgi:drug/metabolite transporter (DMT)-like permease